jgi:uncharacterized BrkB/YihY/UPF0761 family membrane protein
MILLIWLYAAALSFLIGAKIDAEIERAPWREPPQ